MANNKKIVELLEKYFEVLLLKAALENKAKKEQKNGH